jgi:hypothetical protein
MFQVSRRELQAFIDESESDNVGLWEIIWHLRELAKVTDLAKRRASAIDIVRQLLGTGEVVPAQYDPDGSGDYVIWDIDNDAAIRRIESEWDALGREPNVAEIVLFISKQKAERLRQKK